MVSGGIGEVRENSGRVPEDSRRFCKVPEGPTLGDMNLEGYMDLGEVQQPTWPGRTLSLKAHAAGPWEATKNPRGCLGG